MFFYLFSTGLLPPGGGSTVHNIRNAKMFLLMQMELNGKKIIMEFSYLPRATTAKGWRYSTWGGTPKYIKYIKYKMQICIFYIFFYIF